MPSDDPKSRPPVRQSPHDKVFRDPDTLMRWALRILDNNGNENRPFDRYCPYCETTTPHSVYAGRVSCTACGRERPGRSEI
jgi:hypothetical protein